MRHQRRLTGYTLIEVTVVLLIIGVFAVAVFPSIGKSEKARLDAEAQSLTAFLQGVTYRSMIDGAVYGVLVGNNGLSLRFFFDGKWHDVADARQWVPDTGVVLHYRPDQGQASVEGVGPVLVISQFNSPIGSTEFTLAIGEGNRRIEWVDEGLRFEYLDTDS